MNKETQILWEQAQREVLATEIKKRENKLSKLVNYLDAHSDSPEVWGEEYGQMHYLHQELKELRKELSDDHTSSPVL